MDRFPSAPPLLSLVIPVYNEGDNIEAAIRGLEATVTAAPREILIVYDFDEDTTLPVARRLAEEFGEVRLVRNRLGRGVLGALRTGLQDARGTYVLTTMADLSDEPEAIDVMVAAAERGADVVAGSRYMRGGHQSGGPPLKRTLSRAAGLSLHHLARLRTHDATNSFKLYRRAMLETLRIESTEGFAIGLEITVKAHLAGFTIVEVPTTWRDRSAGESRFQLRAWLPQYLRWYWLAMRSRPPSPDQRPRLS